MDNKSMSQNILYGVIGLLLGILLAGYSANNNNGGMMRTMGMGRAYTMMNDSDMGMANMVRSLQGKTGDDFDQAFIQGMIIHHQGAIDMAEEAQKSAKHEEIKKLADDIISAQTKEIGEMRSWYKSWYGKDVEINSITNGMMMH